MITPRLVVLCLLLQSFDEIGAKVRQQHPDEETRDSGFRGNQQQYDSNFQQKPPFTSDQFSSAAQEIYSNLLSLKKQPRHLVRGALQGLQSFAVGGIIGGTLFTGLPVLFALHHGLGGMMGGLIPGTILGSVSTLLGASLGLYQFLLGLYNTPRTLVASVKGQTWDSAENQWIYYNFQEETDMFSGKYPRKGNSQPIDTTFYDLLQVSPDASVQELKQGYKRLAKLYHPDKNSDPAAQDIFLQVHRAYETLTDSKKRDAYDRQGSSQGDFASPIDTNTLFGVILGSHKMNEYTGDLFVSYLTNAIIEGLQAQQNGSEDELFASIHHSIRYQQKRRELQVATNLLKKTKDYRNYLSADAFGIQMAQEAARIAESAMGRMTLFAVGYSLKRESSSFLSIDLGLSDMFLKKVFRYKEKLKLVEQIWRMKTEHQNILQSMEKVQVADDGIPIEGLAKFLPAVTSILLSVSSLDISTTLERSCWRLFHDTSASRSERKRRARAIMAIADAFLHVASKPQARQDMQFNEAHILARFEVAKSLSHHDDDTVSSWREAEQMIQENEHGKVKKTK